MLIKKRASDAELVQEILGGRRNLFAVLVDRYEPLVYSAIRARLGGSADAEDLAQDTFLTAYTNLQALDDAGCFGPWLRRIAANRATSYLRTREVRRRHAESCLPFPDPPQPDQPDELLEAEEERTGLWEAIDALAMEEREVVLMYYMGSRSRAQVAAFMDVPLSTIKGQLRRARQALREKLLDRRIGAAIREEKPGKRRFTRRVMGGLSMLPFLTTDSAAQRWSWWRRGLLLAGGAGLVGLAVSMNWPAVSSSLRQLTGEPYRIDGLKVRLAAVQLPRSAASWAPPRPRAGDRLSIEISGPGLEGESEVFLHCITDPVYAWDEVAPMTRTEDGWVTEIEVPADALTVFFYAAAGASEPTHFDPAVDRPTWKRMFQPYRWAVAVVEEDSGDPRPGAFGNLAVMAELQDEPPARVLRLWGREVSRHPENFEVVKRRWGALLRLSENLDRARAQVEVERRRLRAAYGDRPEALWALAGRKDHGEVYAEIARRFPRFERASEAAYHAALAHLYGDAQEPLIQALEYLIRSFPDSPYVDEAYRLLLKAQSRVDLDGAVERADSLIYQTGMLTYDAELEKRQGSSLFTNAGFLPQGVAYSLRFDVYCARDDFGGARELARHLVDSRLEDPGAYLYIGTKFLGRETPSVLRREISYPRDSTMALDVLEAGAVWATPEHVLTLPGYATGHPRFPEHAQLEMAASNRRGAEKLSGWFADAVDAAAAHLAAEGTGGVTGERADTGARGSKRMDLSRR